MYGMYSRPISFEQQQVLQKGRINTRRNNRGSPHSRQAGNPFEMQQTWVFEQERRNAANLLAMSAYGLHVYCMFAVGGADSRPFRTRKYPRGLEKGRKKRVRERFAWGVCACVEGGWSYRPPVAERMVISRDSRPLFFLSFFSSLDTRVLIRWWRGERTRYCEKAKSRSSRLPSAKKRVGELRGWAGKKPPKDNNDAFYPSYTASWRALLRKRIKKTKLSGTPSILLLLVGWFNLSTLYTTFYFM